MKKYFDYFFFEFSLFFEQSEMNEEIRNIE